MTAEAQETVETGALTKISEAERALELAADIHDMLDLRDQAMAYTVLADARGFQEAAQKAKVFQLRAERKAGDWLKEHGPTQGAGPKKKSGQDVQTLSDMGIHHKEAQRWKLQADLPDDRFNDYVDDALATGKEISAAGLRREARAYQREVRQQEDEEAAENIPDRSELWQLIEDDFRNVVLDAGSVDAVIVDPPYPEEYLDLYESLGSFAEHVLRPGGSLLALVGQAHLPAVFDAFEPYLSYHWTMVLSMSGPHSQMYQLKVAVTWKPILWFVKGKYEGQTIRDTVDAGGMEKDRFDWQQGVGGFAKLVQDFTRPGDMVVDPFCGTGTTGVAAVAQGRQFIGIDNDPARIANSKVRLSEL